MQVSSEGLALAIFASDEGIEAAIDLLGQAGIGRGHLSVVGKDYHTKDQVVGFYNADDRCRFWGKLGAFWSRLSTDLRGFATLTIPGFGYFIVLGPLSRSILLACDGSIAGGFGALLAALVVAGVPKESVPMCERALRADRFLLVLQGSPPEIEKGCAVLETAASASVAVCGL